MAEMAIASNKGMAINLNASSPHAALFGEDQARYICTVSQENASLFAANAEGAGVSCTRSGVVEGNASIIDDLISISVSDLRQTHESWLPAFMDGDNAVAQAAE